MPTDAITAVKVTPQEKQDIQDGVRSLWIFGYFTYLNVIGDELTHKFMARWDLTRGLVGERHQGYA